MSDIILDNIDEQPEEGSAYLHPTPPEEERNEAIEFAEWIMTNHYVHDVDDLAGYYWFQEDIQSQPMLNTKQLYELFKTRNQ